MSSCFVHGIGTEVGKTIVSTVLVRALDAAYWKPVQSGTDQGSDAQTVQNLCGHTLHKIFPSHISLRAPLSPHHAAALEGVSLSLDEIVLPQHAGPIVVEGCGGLLVPLNERQLMVDLSVQLSLPVVLVSRHYLGSINHTLLSLEALHARNLPLVGLIFVGEENLESERIIMTHARVEQCYRFPWFPEVNALAIAEEVSRLKNSEFFRYAFSS